MRWLDPLRRRRASAYGAGRGLDAAIDACRRLAAYGMSSTVGYSAQPDEPPRAVAEVHLAAFERVSREGLDCQVAVKLSALGFDAGLLAELVAAAATTERPLHVDALAPETVDDTWQLLRAASRTAPIGATLPGRWRRSEDDAALIADLGLRVRVVKGQWADDIPGPAVDPAEGFLRVVDRLRRHGETVGVATHDAKLLAVALHRLVASGTPCSAELLFGLPFGEPVWVARRFGVPIRTYVPFGERGATYGIGEAVRNPAAAGWLFQDLLLGKEKTWRSIRRSCPTT